MERLLFPVWDVIVVGAGLGGSTASWQLAQHGLRVLVLDCGPPGSGSGADSGGTADRVRFHVAAPGEGGTDRPIRGGARRPAPTPLGLGPGGSSAFYEAALGRLRRSDFAPGPAEAPEGAGPDGGPNGGPDGDPVRLAPDWPVAYDALRGYYTRAEALMRLSGERDPGDADDDGALAAPPPLGAAEAALARTLAANGLTPYRLRVGFDYLPGCDECIGRRCPRRCRADGASRALAPALEAARTTVSSAGRTTLVRGAAVHSLRPLGRGSRRGGQDPGFEVRGHCRDGLPRTWTARQVVLAAGALNTPLVLARSHDLWAGAGGSAASGPPPMLGRGLMFHVSDKFAVLGLPRSAPGAPRKALAFRDFYGDGAVELGEVHSAGAPLSAGTLMSGLRAWAGRRRWRAWARIVPALRPAAWALARVWGPAPVFSTITEDAPLAANRVREEPPAPPWPAPPGPVPPRIVVDYAPPPGLAARARAGRARLRAAFAPYGLVFLSAPAPPNWGHPMGTCRMGTDPATSVTAPDGAVHGHDGLWVADASVFPASGGTGPSLTVLAHALRVADHAADNAADRAGTRIGARLGLRVVAPAGAAASPRGGAAAREAQNPQRATSTP